MSNIYLKRKKKHREKKANSALSTQINDSLRLIPWSTWEQLKVWESWRDKKTLNIHISISCSTEIIILIRIWNLNWFRLVIQWSKFYLCCGCCVFAFNFLNVSKDIQWFVLPARLSEMIVFFLISLSFSLTFVTLPVVRSNLSLREVITWRTFHFVNELRAWFSL